MTTAEQIVDDFDTYGVTLDDEKLVKRCLELCSQHAIDGEQIVACWLGFSAKHSYDSLDLERLDHFEREELSKKIRNSNKSAGFKLLNANCIDSFVVEDGDLLAAYGGTPTAKNNKRQLTPDQSSLKRHVGPSRAILAQFSPASLSPSVTTPSRKYTERVNPGGVVASFGNVDMVSWKASPVYTPTISIISMGGEEPLTKPYKYMFEKMRDVADVLDEGITALSDQLKGILIAESLDDEVEDDFAHLRVASNEIISSAGRICCDSVGRLNSASVLLEGSREVSGGKSVPLDLSHLKEFSLFPGQVVGVRGVNTTGKKLVVQELIPGCVLPLPDSKITITNLTGPVQIVVACGPFTLNENLLYEPLSDLLVTLCENPPHVLILMGPLLDAAHPLVVTNQIRETHDNIVNRCIRMIIAALEECHTQVVLVSSNRDITSPLVYPTPPYAESSHVTCISDPAMLDIDGVIVAITATDILLHLGKEEISFPPQGSDRLGRLTKHILAQQSLYPLYPPPEGLCVDHERAESHARLPCTPHLLILPSDLRCFIRDIEGCVVLNPERLSKGIVGGSYARLELLSPSSDKCSMSSAINAQVIKV